MVELPHYVMALVTISTSGSIIIVLTPANVIELSVAMAIMLDTAISDCTIVCLAANS